MLFLTVVVQDHLTRLPEGCRDALGHGPHRGEDCICRTGHHHLLEWTLRPGVDEESTPWPPAAAGHATRWRTDHRIRRAAAGAQRWARPTRHRVVSPTSRCRTPAQES